MLAGLVEICVLWIEHGKGARPSGTPEYKSLSMSSICWLQEIDVIQPSWLYLSSKGQVQILASGEEKEWGDKRGTVKTSSSAALGQASPKADIWQYLWAILQILKPPPGGRSELFVAHKHVDPRPVGTRRLMMPDSEECLSWSDPLWTIAIRLLSTCPRSEHIVLKAWDHFSSLCLANQ